MENSRQEHQQSDWPKLTGFKAIRKNFAVAGITPKLATQTYPLNGRIFIGFLILVSAFISLLIYIFKDADTFADYIKSIYVFSLAVVVAAGLLITILKAAQIFYLIDTCNRIIDTSALTNLYESKTTNFQGYFVNLSSFKFQH